MNNGITVNPKTFQPVVSMMTRYGKWVKGYKIEDELGISKSFGLGTASRRSTS